MAVMHNGRLPEVQFGQLEVIPSGVSLEDLAVGHALDTAQRGCLRGAEGQVRAEALGQVDRFAKGHRDVPSSRPQEVALRVVAQVRGRCAEHGIRLQCPVRRSLSVGDQDARFNVEVVHLVIAVHTADHRDHQLVIKDRSHRRSREGQRYGALVHVPADLHVSVGIAWRSDQARDARYLPVVLVFLETVEEADGQLLAEFRRGNGVVDAPAHVALIRCGQWPKELVIVPHLNAPLQGQRIEHQPAPVVDPLQHIDDRQVRRGRADDQLGIVEVRYLRIVVDLVRRSIAERSRVGSGSERIVKQYREMHIVAVEDIRLGQLARELEG